MSLFLDEKKTCSLANKYGTPLYVYDEKILRRRCRDLLEAFDGRISPSFSIKANSNLSLLKIIKEEGIGADAMSPGEIFLLEKAGFQSEEIFYVGNNVSAEEISFAIERNILVSVDSLAQLELFGEINPGGKVAVRFNPGLGAGHCDKVVTGGKKTKFGVQAEFVGQVKEIAETQLGTIFALAKLAESRDDETGDHLERVRTCCRLLAEALLQMPECETVTEESFVRTIEQASSLHDIGKVGIPDGILLKPGRLTPAEFEKMKEHTLIGARTLESVRERYPHNDFLVTCIEIVRWHHERWDGAGYPDGLNGGIIPLTARIMAVADVYDALRSRRCYKAPLSHEESGRILREGSGSQFDPLVIKAFFMVENEIVAAYEAIKENNYDSE